FSATCLTCMVLESSIKSHVASHLDANSIISVNQFGFIKRRSTTLLKLCLLNEWSNYSETPITRI
ncbi:hypothetical protein CAPTEDRAFT_92284, partial [Capitella teleta]